MTMATFYSGTNYYNPELTPIYKLNKTVYDYIRQSYYGGVVDVYKPKLNNGYDHL
jgi:hypothetical protein